jgi:hypothetical protein
MVRDICKITASECDVEANQQARAEIRVMRAWAGAVATGGFSYYWSSERELYSF